MHEQQQHQWWKIRINNCCYKLSIDIYIYIYLYISYYYINEYMHVYVHSILVSEYVIDILCILIVYTCKWIWWYRDQKIQSFVQKRIWTTHTIIFIPLLWYMDTRIRTFIHLLSVFNNNRITYHVRVILYTCASCMDGEKGTLITMPSGRPMHQIWIMN